MILGNFISNWLILNTEGKFNCIVYYLRAQFLFSMFDSSNGSSQGTGMVILEGKP